MLKKIILVSFLLALCYSVLDLYSREAFIVDTCQQESVCNGQSGVSSSRFTENVRKYYEGSMGRVVPERSILLILNALALLGISVYLIKYLWDRQRQQSDLMYWGSIQLAFALILVAVTIWHPDVSMMSLKNLLELLAGLGVIALVYRVYLGGRGKRDDYEGDYSGYKWLPRLALFFLSFEVVSGGWLGGNMAGYGCPDLFACLNEWMQQIKASSTGAVSPLLSGSAQPLSSGATRDTLYWFCRAVTFAALLVMLVMARLVKARETRDRLFDRQVLVIAGLFVLQLAIAEWAVHFSWSMVLPVVHHLVTVVLFLLLINLEFHVIRSKVRHREDSAGTAVVSDGASEAREAGEAGAEEDKAGTETAESVFERFRDQLGKTRGMFAGFAQLGSRVEISDAFLEEIEDTLLMADVGMEATQTVVTDLKQTFANSKDLETRVMLDRVREKLLAMIAPCSKPLVIDEDRQPFVILVVGVNGVGKTTTIGKLARQFQNQGRSVMLAAGDTFRAAAVEQLKTWGERNQVPVVSQHSGADSASVIYDALESARARKIDVLIADTAGRLHTKSNLMEELSKIKRIMAKLDDSAPHEVLLVLDAGTGQNAISQARQFNEAVGLTGIVLTKLDGTAKGGVVFGLASELEIPIRYIGIGEKVGDLREFDARLFVDTIMPPSDN